MSESDKQHKLFIKSMCMVCLNKVMSCYYCNGMGTVFVEASDKGIGRWLAKIDEERREDIMYHMEDEKGQE